MVNMEEFPLLVYDKDECSIRESALAYVDEKHDMLINGNDFLHHTWNAMKKAAQNHGQAKPEPLITTMAKAQKAKAKS